MTNINFGSVNPSEYNEIFLPEIIESQAQSEGKEVHKLILTPDQFTKQAMYEAFNISSWVNDGFTYNDHVSLYVPNKELICSHMVTISHVMRFNSEFNRVVPGTTQIYSAQNPNHDKGKYTEYDKEHPLGKDGKKIEITGRGLVAGLNETGGLDYDNVLLSKFFSHEENDNAVREALEDVFSNTLEGEHHVYESDYLQLAAVYKQTGSINHVNKQQRKRLITVTKRTETAVNSIFSFNWEEYGITDREDVNIARIHNVNRNRFTQYLGGLAQASGVQVGQYAQFVIMGFPYSANTVTPKLEDKYKDKAAFVRFHHNKKASLPAGVVILCKPVKYVQVGSSGAVGNNNSKSRLLKALGKRAASSEVAAPTPKLPVQAIEPAFKPFVLPTEYATVTTEVASTTVKVFDINALQSISLDEMVSNEPTIDD